MPSSKISFVPACMLISALVAGCNRDADTPATTAEQPVREGETPPAGTPAGTPVGDRTLLTDDAREFVMAAATHGMFEVEAGKLAQTKAQLEGVKQLANKMVDEYGKHNDELRELVKDKNVMLPTALTDDAKDTWDDLAKEEGKGFDKDYVDAVIDRHEKAIDEVEEQSKADGDPQLKTWAAKMLPIMRGHLDEAKRVKEHTVEPQTNLFD
jgi:putative membrane protein